MKSLKSNLYKFRKTKGHLIHIVLPIVGIILFALYSLISAFSEFQKIGLFLEVLAIMMPGVIAVVIAKLYEEERKSGSFQNILTYHGSRLTSHTLNMAVLLMWGFVAIFVGVVGYGVVMRLLGYDMFSIGWYIKGAILIFICNLCCYLLTYIVCFSFGSGIALGFGIIGTLLAAILRLGIGDYCWMFIPGSYSTRIILSILKIDAVEFADSADVIRYLLYKGIPAVFVLTFMSFIVYLIWAFAWQGNRNAE